MKSDPTNMYLLDFGDAGSYIFKSTDDEVAERHAAGINDVLRNMVEREYPDYDFSLLNKAHVRRLTNEEAASHADWPRLTPEVLNKIAAQTCNEAAATSAVGSENADAPWSDIN